MPTREENEHLCRKIIEDRPDFIDNMSKGCRRILLYTFVENGYKNEISSVRAARLAELPPHRFTVDRTGEPTSETLRRATESAAVSGCTVHMIFNDIWIAADDEIKLTMARLAL